MSPRFKVHANAYGTLCARCESGQVFEQQNGKTSAFCHAKGVDAIAVPLDIVRCTDFRDSQQTSRYEMEKIAWLIRHDKSGAIRGFEPPPKKRDD